LQSNSDKNTIPEYKHCVGKGCRRKGIHYLRIQFLNKYGWFCDSCKEFLIQDKLIDKVDEIGKTRQIFEQKGVAKNK